MTAMPSIIFLTVIDFLKELGDFCAVLDGAVLDKLQLGGNAPAFPSVAYWGRGTAYGGG